MTNTFSAEDGAMRRAHIEAVLASYPHVGPEETALLISWFRKEASALDVGIIASDPLLDKNYQQFKADHLDRIRGADLVRAFLLVSTAVVAILAIVWAAL
jgi:hypothetical protein